MPLPSGYRQIEYVQSNGTGSYFRTGIRPTGNTRVLFDGCVVSGDTALYGSRYNNADNRYAVQFISSNMYRLGYNTSESLASSSYRAGTRYTFDQQNGVLFIDGTQVAQVSGTATFPNAQEIFAVGALDTKGNATNLGVVRMYAMQIYQDDILVRDFVAAKDTAGVIGIFDSVTQAFYPNAGSGAVTGGPELAAVTGITIAAPPTKTDYITGDALDTAGLVVTATYSDGTSAAVTDYTLSGYASDAAGVQHITVTYEAFTAAFSVTVHGLTGLSVTTQPTKTDYITGDALDTTGLVVSAVYDNGTTEDVTDYTLSGYDSAGSGIQTITAAYRGQAAAFEVTVHRVVGIAITPPTKLTYRPGDPLDTAGLTVAIVCEDEYSVATTDYTVTGYQPTTTGAQTVTVTYQTYTASFAVTVIVVGIALTTPPDTTECKQGTAFDATGMVVQYTDETGGTTAVTGYTISGYDKTTLGVQTLTVTYLDYTCTFDITVVRNLYTEEIGTQNAADVVATLDLYTTDVVITGTGAVRSSATGTNDLLVGSGLTSFRDLTVEEGITELGAKAFFSCRLRNITLPASLTGLGDYALVASDRLESITVAHGNQSFCTVDGVLYNADKTKLIAAPVAWTGSIPNTVTEIGAYACSYSTRTALAVPNSVIHIRQGAFYYCKYIETLTLGNSLETIGSYAFYYAASNSTYPIISCLSFPDTLKSIGDYAFCYCKRIYGASFCGSFVTSNSLVSIGKCAFQNTNIKSSNGAYIYLPGSLKTIGANAFSTYGKIIFYFWAVYGSVSGAPWGTKNTVEWITDQLSRIEVTTPPEKTTYQHGEQFDPTGLVVSVVDINGKIVAITDYELSGYDGESAGIQTITVSYQSYTAAFQVKVGACVGITVSPPTKTAYLFGEALDTQGMTVVVVSEDGSTENVTDYTLSGYDSSTAGTQTITVTYNGMTASFPVTVSACTGISITALPDKTTYRYGEALDISGMVISATYEGGESAAVTDYIVSGYDAETVGEKTVTVTYLTFSAHFTVTVQNYLVRISLVHEPDKVSYQPGEQFDPAGLVVAQVMADGTQIETDDYTLSVPDMSLEGTQEITVSSGGQTASFSISILPPQQYTVTWVDYDGKVLKTESVEESHAATPPDNPIRSGYLFTGWSGGSYTSVTGDLTLTAQYTAKNVYTVVFTDGVSRLSTQYVAKGRPAAAPAPPEREGAAFAGWDTDFSSVTTDLTISPTWSEKTDRYEVAFVDDTDSPIATVTAAYGEEAAAPEAPVREGYDFIGWDACTSYIKANTRAVAIYHKQQSRTAAEIYWGKQHLGTIRMATSATISQKLNGECTLALTTLASQCACIHQNCTIALCGLIFTVTGIERTAQNGVYLATISGEHASYVLNDEAYTITKEFNFTGSPRKCLGRLLTDSAFSVGKVDFSEPVTLRINQEVTCREAVMQLVALCGGEIEYDRYTIGIRSHVGSSTRRALMNTKNVKSIGMTSDFEEGTESYDIELYHKVALHVGDEINLSFAPLGIHADKRIYGLEYNPFNFREIRVTVGTYQPTLSDELYKIKTDQSKQTDIDKKFNDYDTRIDSLATAVSTSETTAGSGYQIAFVNQLPEEIDVNKIYFVIGGYSEVD